MSQLRLGIRPDGTRDILEQEPAVARRQGFGGTAAGFWSGTKLSPHVRSATEIAAQKRRDARRGPRKRGVPV